MKYLRIFVINAVVIIQLGAMDEGDIKHSAAREIERKESSASSKNVRLAKSKNVRLAKLRLAQASFSRYTSAAFNPYNEQQLLVGDDNGTLTYWDLESGGTVVVPAFKGKVSAISFIEGNTLLASNDTAVNLVIRRDENKFSSGTIIQLASKILSFATRIKPRSLVSASYDGAYTVWDVPTRKSTRELVSAAAEPACAVKYLTDDCVIVGAEDSSLLVFDVREKEPVQKLVQHTSMITSLDVDEQEQRFLSGSYDGTAVLWDQRMFKPLYCVTQKKSPAPILSVALTPRGQTWSPCVDKFLCGTMNGCVLRMSAGLINGAKEKEVTYTVDYLNHTARVTSVAANNCYQVSASYDGTLMVYGLLNKKIGANAFNPEDDCSICLLSLRNNKNRGALTCKHVFHLDCIKSSLSYKKECPLCKAADDEHGILSLAALTSQEQQLSSKSTHGGGVVEEGCPLCTAPLYVAVSSPELEKEQSSSASTQSSGSSKDKLQIVVI